MQGKRLQIDVLEEIGQNKNFITCCLTIGERDCRFIITKNDYEALIRDKVFIRDGKTPDSANVWNTTNAFIEEIF